MLQKIKEWLFNKKAQFSLFTKVENHNTTVCVHLHKCNQVVDIGDWYSCSWSRGLLIMFRRPDADMVHIDYVIGYYGLDGIMILRNTGTLEADEIRYVKGVFRIRKLEKDEETD